MTLPPASRPDLISAKKRATAVASLAAEKLDLTADQEYRLSMILWGAFGEAQSAALASEPEPQPVAEIRIIFDGFPSPNGPRFIEVENAEGRSISVGHWRRRDDGLCELVIS